MNPSMLILVFLEGLLAFISPCILPMLPIYFIYLSGKSVPIQDGETKRKHILLRNTALFILGFTIVFVGLGVAGSALGSLLSRNMNLLEKISGILIILLGIFMTGLIRIPFLESEKRIKINNNKRNALSSLLMGIAFSLGWSPCIGPFLGAALLKAGQTDTVLQGGILLTLFSLGLAIPFFISALLLEQLKPLFKKLNEKGQLIRLVSGILLILIGISMFMGWYRILSQSIT